MQGLADGYFIIPYTIGNYLANIKPGQYSEDAPAVREAVANVSTITKRLLSANGKRTVDSYHRELGKITWEYCGMARNAAGLKKAAGVIAELREDYWKNVRVLGSNEEFNQSLEKAGRVADFFELAELMCIDALQRNESCGGHFREEYQTEENEAKRNDERFSYVGAWEYKGLEHEPALHKEPLTYEYVKPGQRSYK
jgi:succinate dehydrogenase / fumarate reductase flavoprotein subunit